MSILLDAGADPTARRADGSTPLALVAGSGSKRAAAELNAAEAKWIDARGSLLESKTRRAALVSAVARRNLTRVQDLLAHGTDPNSADDRGITAIEIACAMGHVRLLRVLISAGATVNRSTADRAALTLIHIAAAVGRRH